MHQGWFRRSSKGYTGLAMDIFYNKNQHIPLYISNEANNSAGEAATKVHSLQASDRRSSTRKTRRIFFPLSSVGPKHAFAPGFRRCFLCCMALHLCLEGAPEGYVTPSLLSYGHVASWPRRTNKKLANYRNYVINTNQGHFLLKAFSWAGSWEFPKNKSKRYRHDPETVQLWPF